METYKKYLTELHDMKPEQAQKEIIAYLEKVQKALPKAISEFKKDKIGSTASGLIHSMSNISNTDFYDHYFS